MKNRSRSLTLSRSSNAFREMRRRQRRLPGVGVHRRQQRVRHRERRVELDRALQMRNRFEPRHLAAFVQRERVRVKRVERGVVARGSGTSNF